MAANPLQLVVMDFKGTRVFQASVGPFEGCLSQRRYRELLRLYPEEMAQIEASLWKSASGDVRVGAALSCVAERRQLPDLVAEIQREDCPSVAAPFPNFFYSGNSLEEFDWFDGSYPVEIVQLASPDEFGFLIRRRDGELLLFESRTGAVSVSKRTSLSASPPE
jgi:hypothetical protein